jgi:hypothetical protein
VSDARTRNLRRKTAVERPARHDAHCAEHGRARGATMGSHLGDAWTAAHGSTRPRERPRGVRFHPGALRDDAMSPLYDLLAQATRRTGGADAEWSPLRAVAELAVSPANGTEPYGTQDSAALRRRSSAWQSGCFVNSRSGDRSPPAALKGPPVPTLSLLSLGWQTPRRQSSPPARVTILGKTSYAPCEGRV